jgi:hypothetical protein
MSPTWDNKRLQTKPFYLTVVKKEALPVKPPEKQYLEVDLRRYLRGKSTLFSSEISEVMADVNRFTSAILRHGFRQAFQQLPGDVKKVTGSPFIQACDALVEYHTRFVDGVEAQWIGKSLFEAYIHFAGPAHILGPVSRTRLPHSLRRRGPKGFAATLLSLHLFNLVSMEIRDDVHTNIRDLQSFELHMFSIEAACRDVIVRAMKVPDGKLDAQWAAAVCRNIETELLAS